MAVAQLLERLAERWPLVAVAAVALVGSTVIQSLYRYRLLSLIPYVGADYGDEEKRRMQYITGAKTLYNEAYAKFKDGICRMTTTRSSPVLIVSPKYLSELQKLPDEVLSFHRATAENLEAKYTKLNTEEKVVVESVKADLTPALVRLNPTIAAEVEEVFALELPTSKEWTPVNINQKLLRIVGMVSGRVFIGPELCHEEEYLNAAINYTVDVMKAVQAVQSIPQWQRFFRARFLPEVRSINQWVRRAKNFLEPVISRRMEAARRLGDKYEKPDDMLQWLMEGSARRGIADVHSIAQAQLGLSFAAIHTTTMTATNAFYTLATMPEFQEELRQETRQVLAETNGVFTSAALQKMKKLDSFLRETMRFDPAAFASFNRKVLKPFTLSSGQVIPAGVMIEVPAIAVNFDDKLHADSDRFDPLRFYKLRQGDGSGTRAAEAGAMNQFVSVNQSHLTFGYGRHACPGRFFAANEIKMIVANAVMRYDIKNMDGVEGRIPNLVFGIMTVPDGSKELMFKRIAD